MFTEETDYESARARLDVFDYFELTGFGTGMFILPCLNIPRLENTEQ